MQADASTSKQLSILSRHLRSKPRALMLPKHNFTQPRVQLTGRWSRQFRKGPVEQNAQSPSY